MLALFLALMAAVMLVDSADTNYQLHGAVVFTRTGERTPSLDTANPTILTPLGAQQMYVAGGAFRSRYISALGGQNRLDYQPLIGISQNTIDNDQLHIMAPDQPYLVASAQAFMQGLYPSFALNGTAITTSKDDLGWLANGSYITSPLNGYQYSQIRVAAEMDPNSIYLAGNENCPNLVVETNEYYATQEFINTRLNSHELYQSVGSAILKGVLSQPQWDYLNAYNIFEYLKYNYTHDSEAYSTFTNNNVTVLTNNKITYDEAYRQAQYLADEHEWALYGNISSSSTSSQIRAISGKTLAALILGQLQRIVMTRGNSEALSLFFGDHQPFLSLFSLLELDYNSPDFKGIPDWGSSVVFELYSNATSTDFPTSSSDLRVRFSFQNGTNYTGLLQSFPLFARPRSDQDMSWDDFQDMMSRVMTSEISDWCNACNSKGMFCVGVDNTSNIYYGFDREIKKDKVKPVVAGVIGAIVSLAIAGIVFAFVMLLGGVRFHRVHHDKKSQLGGFKGSSKLASDADLQLPKNGAVAGIVPLGHEGDKKEPRERVGSWELRQKEGGKGISDRLGESKDIGYERSRGSFEEIEASMRPVQPEDRV